MTHATKKRKSSAAKQFAEIERISIAGINERMGPLGLHMYAESYLSAAQLLPKPNVPFEPVRPYLVCHAIELALKAYLSLRGSAMVDLADGAFGHNLDSLFTRAVEGDLAQLAPLTNAQSNAIRLATTYYAGKVFEYPAVGEALAAYPQSPPVEVLFEAAVCLVEALRQPCREAK
ncbi:MAG: hypothetical protein RL042_2379 [Nitrospirota bacterium]|jgi:hypothetical protein